MRLQFVLSEIFVGLWRNLAMAVSVVIVTAVSLTFVGAGLLMQQQVSTMKDYWFDKVQVTVYLCSKHSDTPSCATGEVSEAQQKQIRAELEGDVLNRYVDEVFVESKQQALDNFEEQFANSSVVQHVSVDDMPVSYRIRLTDPEKSQVIVDAFSGRDGVDQVVDQQKVFGPIITILNRATVFSLGLAGFMLIAAALLVATTIRMSAANRRKETAIMRLVGASNMFIRLPFLLEGAIAAAVGAALASGALFYSLKYLDSQWLSNTAQLTQTPYITTADVLIIMPVLFGIGIVLAAFSSVISLNRYMKV